MSVLYKSCIVRRLWAVFLGLPLLCACSLVNDKDDPVEPSPSTETAHYINLNIVVSSGNEGTGMRVPTSDEDDYVNGDGREKGDVRENTVQGITLMLYQTNDPKGINTDENVTFDFVRYYTVTERKVNNSEKIEVSYTTGNQPLADTDISLNVKYHAIVVANRNMEDKIGTTTTVKDVREMMTEEIYTLPDNQYGGVGIGVEAKNFVMASAEDTEIMFTNPTNDVIDGKPALVYSFDGINIERLAARVDFWTNKSTGYDAAKKGYVYTAENDAGTFVLTAVTPFNLYNEKEYYLKRLSDGYLEKETKTNWVIDPKTNDKITPSSVPPYYVSPLHNLIELDKSTAHTLLSSDFYQSMESLSTDGNKQQVGFSGDNEKPNFILCYPKENTMRGEKDSPLYYYATGVAIEGNYYAKGSETPEHLIYYGFLRHRGESNSPTDGIYEINAATYFTDIETLPAGEFPMNFSIVRNNIYRISIDRIKDRNNLVLSIRVKKWDTFTHETIYM